VGGGGLAKEQVPLVRGIGSREGVTVGGALYRVGKAKIKLGAGWLERCREHGCSSRGGRDGDNRGEG